MVKNGRGGGHLVTEWPVSYYRNRWSVRNGISGQLVPEYATDEHDASKVRDARTNVLQLRINAP